MYGYRLPIMTGTLVHMNDHRTPARTGTVYVAQRRLAVGMTLGVLAGVVWAIAMICTLASWML